jgi:hypothetical protein
VPFIVRLVAPLFAIGRLAKDREGESLPAVSNYLEPKVLNFQATFPKRVELHAFHLIGHFWKGPRPLARFLCQM